MTRCVSLKGLREENYTCPYQIYTDKTSSSTVKRAEKMCNLFYKIAAN